MNHPRTHKDALWHREELYHGVCADALIHDARMDVLRLLNVYTDIADPTYEQICAMEKMAKAVHCLEEERERPEWALMYPDVFNLKREMDVAIDKFFIAKGKGEEASGHLKEVFRTHKELATKVKSLCATPAEMEVITHG